MVVELLLAAAITSGCISPSDEIGRVQKAFPKMLLWDELTGWPAESFMEQLKDSTGYDEKADTVLIWTTVKGWSWVALIHEGCVKYHGKLPSLMVAYFAEKRGMDI